eukprot:9483832-Pyramimonas_sp.AAC.1
MMQLRALLFTPALWMLIHEPEMTNRARSLAFRQISKAGAGIEKSLVRPHCGYPWKLFTLIDQPDMASIIAADPPCLLDPWSKRMLESGDLGSMEFRHRLVLHAELAETNTSPVESGHAQVHRFVKSRLQTHAIDMPQLSAQWSGYHIRSSSGFGDAVHGRACGPSEAGSGGRDGAEHGDGDAEEVKKGGGGAWRAYLRFARTNDLREAAVAYNALPRDSD